MVGVEGVDLHGSPIALCETSLVGDIYMVEGMQILKALTVYVTGGWISSSLSATTVRDKVKECVGEYSCNWYYELLLGCERIETISKHKCKHKYDLAQQMDDKALRYIGLVNDHQQFLGVGVTYGTQRGVEVYMYQQSSSSTA